MLDNEQRDQLVSNVEQWSNVQRNVLKKVVKASEKDKENSNDEQHSSR